MTQKGNICLSIVQYVKLSYPNNNDVLAPIFIKISIYNVKAKNLGVEIVICTWYINMLRC